MTTQSAPRRKMEMSSASEETRQEAHEPRRDQQVSFSRVLPFTCAALVEPSLPFRLCSSHRPRNSSPCHPPHEAFLRRDLQSLVRRWSAPFLGLVAPTVMLEQRYCHKKKRNKLDTAHNAACYRTVVSDQVGVVQARVHNLVPHTRPQ